MPNATSGLVPKEPPVLHFVDLAWVGSAHCVIKLLFGQQEADVQKERLLVGVVLTPALARQLYEELGAQLERSGMKLEP